MPAPTDRRYLQTHEWHKQQGDIITIGITQFAADELTDITFIDLPKVGAKIQANQRFGEIESVKATSDLYSGVGGTVTEVNPALQNEPGLINRDPYEGGWMIKLQVANPAELTKLLSSDDYLKKIGQE
ncbi:MAG: glycine cleavage system protein GcvH [Phycisphaerales bacterium]|jgi:glycine cleavage system H protein|nr:glycine cleavage system protein GcvH [Phycisphaerales bacterium]